MRSNNTHINLLCTYASCGTSKELTQKLVSLSRSGKANIMIDSGGFTAYNAQKEYPHINVHQYCEYLEKYGDEFEKYVALDVIGNAEASKENYIKMVKNGFKPMYVVTTADTDYDYILSTLEVTPNICVAGGAMTKCDWMTKRFQDIYKYTNCRAKIHGLAYVTFPKMLQLNLASVDSSSWKAAPLRFGSLQYFDNGIKNIATADILRSGKLTNKTVIRLLEMCHITPKMFSNKKYHHGNNNMQCLLAIYANIQMQKYCYKRGLRYFLAVNNMSDIRKIEYVINNGSKLNYEDFLKLK